MKKVVTFVIIILIVFISGIIYVNVTREVPVVCTLDNKTVDKDEVELYVDGDYVKKYVSYLEFYGNKLENLDRERAYYSYYVEPRNDEIKYIYKNSGLVYDENPGEISWIELRSESNFTIYFDDESIDVDLISGSSILKGIKIENSKVTLKYFIEELEKQGYECDD